MKTFLQTNKKIFTIIGSIIIAAVFLWIGLKIGNTGPTTDGQTTKLRFENIGELATQSAYTTEVEVTDDDKKIFGISVPFTEAKQIYSYNVNVKAGYDFTKITYDVNDEKKEITITLPEVQTLSTELDTNSFKIYHEQTSAFTHIDLETQNKAISQMCERAEQSAIENGLYENAQKNAELVLKGFFSSAYDLDEYTLTFKTN